MRIPYEAPTPLGSEYIELAPEVTAAIILTLVAGWKHAITSVGVPDDAGEVLITERLRDSMRATLKSGHFPWRKTMVVLPGAESRSSAAKIPDGRTDIPILIIEIFIRTQEHDPHAIIECKRISGVDSHLCREYVVEGVDRFRKGKYGHNHAVGFMTGYVISGTAEDAVSGVNSYLSGVSRKDEHLNVAQLCDEATWISTHPRSPPPSITLHHAFLDCEMA